MWYRLTKLRLRLAAWLVGDNGMVMNVSIGKGGAGVYVETGKTLYASGVSVVDMEYGFLAECGSGLISGGSLSCHNTKTGFAFDSGPLASSPIG